MAATMANEIVIQGRKIVALEAEIARLEKLVGDCLCPIVHEDSCEVEAS